MVIILIKMIRVREAGGRVEQSSNWQSSLATWEKADGKLLRMLACPVVGGVVVVVWKAICVWQGTCTCH